LVGPIITLSFNK